MQLPGPLQKGGSGLWVTTSLVCRSRSQIGILSGYRIRWWMAPWAKHRHWNGSGRTEISKAIQLLIDLYDSQNLREDGGISRNIVFQPWDRLELGSYGEFTIWGFMPSRQTTARAAEIVKAQWDADAKSREGRYAPFWRRLVILQDCGLIEWVPCLFESGDEDAEIIHTMLLSGDGGPEDRLARAAVEAGLALLNDGQRERAYRQGVLRILPVKRHVSSAQLITIARLRYRPHTKRTSAWWAELNSACEAHIHEYESLRARAQDSVILAREADLAG